MLEMVDTDLAADSGGPLVAHNGMNDSLTEHTDRSSQQNLDQLLVEHPEIPFPRLDECDLKKGRCCHIVMGGQKMSTMFVNIAFKG